MEPGTIVNTIGLIIRVGRIEKLPKKSPSENRTIRKIEIVDESFQKITLKLWGENVNRDDYCEGKTLLLLDGRIN